jgi:opacity protein-like surface antigen
MTYLFGPTFNMRSNDKIMPFAHALFGRVSDSASNSGVSASIGAFGYGVGGGLDYHLNQNWSIRAVQLDYLRASFSTTNPTTNTTTSTGINHIRISAGVVWNWGKTR